MILRWSDVYRPFPKQARFHESPAKYRLFGGAAGPGKSLALLMEGVKQAHLHPGIDTLLMRRTYPELEQSLLKEFRTKIPRAMYQSFNESKHVVTWHNGSHTRFGYCQSENDVYQYQGGEYLFIGIDELTLFTLKQWQFLTSRNRCPVPGSFPCMAGASNPGNLGHKWVKALWMDHVAPPGWESAESYDAREYEYIPALISDNPIYASDENYLQTLRRLPTHLRHAFLDGDWNIFAGQYFDKFGAQNIDKPEVWEMRPWWPRWISIDWGFEHPAAVYWHAIDDRGRSLTYRELVRNKLAPRELARAVAEASRDANGQQERIGEIYLSPDAFAKKTDEQTIAEKMGEEFERHGLPYPTQADNDRVGGWMLMYQMLESGHWRIGENCPALIRTLPMLIRDEKKMEDVAKVDDQATGSGMIVTAENCSGDDPADAARYGLKSRHSPGRKPLTVRVQEGVEKRIGMPLTDVKPEQYTQVMMQRAIVEEQERKSQRPMRISRRRR